MMKKVMSPSRGTLLAQIQRIRYLEESLLDLFSKGALFGTTHTSIGQEAVAVAVMEALDLSRDVVFSSHRCHGHFLAYGGDMTALLAEVMGRATGVCGGMGGSQHLHYRNFYSNGVQGGIVPLAVGAAVAERFRRTGAIAVVFLGDGTLGEGATYESLNMASLWSAPVLFVLEDNGYAQTTPRKLGVAGSITARAAAFGVEADAIESNDVEEILSCMRPRVHDIRNYGRPFFQVVHTYRLAPHSKGDDFRDPKEIEAWRERDPIRIVSSRLSDQERDEIQQDARVEIEAAVENAQKSPWPEPGSLKQRMVELNALVPGCTPMRVHATPDSRTGIITVGRELNAALHAMMSDDDRVVLIGEDLFDPYGGAFKITQGLSTRFPDRTITTPISEAGLVGVANGMALRGLRPVAEIMFGDFMALAADQIINHAAKFEGMYNCQVRCPVTIRTPMGGRRGYGPTHSQSIESAFLGLPGIEIVAPSPFHPVGELLRGAVLRSERPTLFIENKLMYPRPLRLPDGASYVDSFAIRYGDGLYPTAHLSIDAFQSCDLVLITYGGSAEMAIQAAEHLMIEREIACDVLVPSQLSPIALSDLMGSVLKAGRAIILEEGMRAWGWGAELAAELYEQAGGRIPGGGIRRLGARPFTIPVSRPLEEFVLPQVQDVCATALSLLDGK